MSNKGAMGVNLILIQGCIILSYFNRTNKLNALAYNTSSMIKITSETEDKKIKNKVKN